ncbi:hypothetical protein Tco_0377352 [Tanacetum coccineum]
MGKRISSGCTELVKPFESTNEGQDTSCEPSHLSIDNAPHQVTSWFTEDKHLINQYLLQKAVVKFVGVVEEAIPGLNMSIVTSHINMEVDTISHIDIRNNSLNKNLRSATASHHHNSEIEDKVVPNYHCASTPKNLMCGLILTGLKEKELQGRIKVKMEMQRQLSSILSQLQRPLFNECLVEEESEVEVPETSSSLAVDQSLRGDPKQLMLHSRFLVPLHALVETSNLPQALPLYPCPHFQAMISRLWMLIETRIRSNNPIGTKKSLSLHHYEQENKIGEKEEEWREKLEREKDG